MSKLWAEHDAELDELDREYYRSKLEELSRCLPVVRAAVLAKNSWRGDRHGLASIFTTLAETVEAYEAAKEARDE